MVLLKSFITNCCICYCISINFKKSTRKLCGIYLLWLNSMDVFFISNNKVSIHHGRKWKYCKKVYFPREILPISIVTSEAVNFLISTIIILAFVIFGGIGISKYIIFYPLVLVAQYVLLIAIGLIVSSISVYVRDLQHLIGVALQLFFYATPIVYSADVIPAEYRWILNINPMTYIIEAYRDIFYNQTMIDIVPLLLLIVGSLVACVIGYMIFNKLQKGFAEQL